MIKDSMTNMGFYTGISESITRALRYLRTVDMPAFREKKMELEGTDVVALHQEYTTEPADGRLFENHTDHIDVQFVLAGTETIRVADVHTLSPATVYDPIDDVTLYVSAEGTDVRLSAGDFVILFPQDAHIPKIQFGSPSDVKKVVVKIALRPMEVS